MRSKKSLQTFLLALCFAIAGQSMQLSAVTLSVGDDYLTVRRLLGEPDGELGMGNKQILTYGSGKITLRDGKVVSFSEQFGQQLADRSADKADLEAKRAAGLINHKGEWMTPAQRDAAVAKEAAKVQAENRAKTASLGAWFTDFAAASQVAQSQNKKLLLNFTGSDWCGWCIKLDQEVFSQASFKEYAASNYVLVKLDFPQRIQIPAAEKKQNEALAQKYGIRGFPTIIVLNPDGSLHAKGGYVSGGPPAFIASIQ